MPKEKTQRNIDLYQDWKNGMSYYALGKKYEMSQPAAYRKVQRMKKLEEQQKTK